MKRSHCCTSFSLLLSFVAFSSLLTGCGANQPLAPDPQPAIPLQGVVHGGQSPISGAHIYLMAANPTTFKGASTSLLTKGDSSDAVGFYVLTGTDGSFNVSNDYTCTPGNQVYLLAMGGNPGNTPATYNTAATMVALFGTCPSTDTFAGVIPYIVVNEVSTVAAAYSVAGFATDYAHIGSANTTSSQKGLANAFLSAGNMVSLSYGQAYTKTPAVAGYSATSGLSANGTVPQAKIYSLANSLGSCVNSTSTAATTSSACTSLFQDTPSSTGTLATNVFDSALNLAHNPGIITSAPTSPNYGVFALANKTSPFYQGLATAPTDWTISIKYSAPNAGYPARCAIDASGNVWIPNVASYSLTELSTTGVVLSGTAGYTGGGLNLPEGIAIDTTSPTGAVWVSNYGSGTISKFSLSGTPISTTGYTTSNGASYDAFMKGSSPVIVGESAVTLLSTTGSVSSSYVSTGSFNVGVTVDPSGNVWAAQDVNNTISKYAIAGTTLTPTAYSGGGLADPVSMSSDSAGDIWIANSNANTLSEFGPTGSAVSTTGYTGGGLLKPYSVRVDGAGKVIAGNSNGSLSIFSAGTVTGSPAAGTPLSGTSGYTTASTANYTPGSLILGVAPSTGIVGLAIDQAGNVWAPDLDNSLYEFIGLASPVVP